MSLIEDMSFYSTTIRERESTFVKTIVISWMNHLRKLSKNFLEQCCHITHEHNRIVTVTIGLRSGHYCEESLLKRLTMHGPHSNQLFFEHGRPRIYETCEKV